MAPQSVSLPPSTHTTSETRSGNETSSGLSVVTCQVAKTRLPARTLPQVPVQMWRRSSNSNLGTRRCATDAAGGFLHGPQPTGPNQSDRLNELLLAALLGSNLNDPPGLLADLADLTPFGDRQGHRLFAIDILASQHCFDRDLRMPVIGRGDMDNVDPLVIEDRSIVRMPGRLHTGPFLDNSRCQVPPSAVRITDCDVVTVLAKVGSRTPRSVDSRGLLAPATSCPDRSDAGAFVRRDEPLARSARLSHSAATPAEGRT